MKHSIFLARILVICSLIFVCSLWFKKEFHVRADITSESIGKAYSETENGQAVVGIRINADGAKVSYAYDVWQHQAAIGWKFQYAKLVGTVYNDQKMYLGDDGYLTFMQASGTNRRIRVSGSRIKNYLETKKKTDCYMIETVRYQRGQEISREYEYSDSTAAECVSAEYSLMLALRQDSNFCYGGCGPEEISCEYNIYTGLRMGTGKDISVIATGASITQEGTAYFTKKDYVVKTLPKAVKPQDTFRYELEGWYTQPEGGEEVRIGSLVSKATKLYARWKKIPVTYPVTCIDLLKTDQRDLVLGSSTWRAGYGDLVSGSQAGDEIQMGAYYEGREYTGCSSSKVGTEGAVVYRYFKNSFQTVTCIDSIAMGPDNGQQLGTTVWEEPYTAVVSGGVLGCNKETGVYYKGYSYISSTTQKVGTQGCKIYRYFTPVSYEIQFVSNCTSGGSMSPLKNCFYGHGYNLSKNSFVFRNKLTLNLNAEGALCDTTYQYVYQEFAGWSDSPDGAVVYSDGCEVNNLCEDGGIVKLYAVWRQKEITVTAQPQRPGYEFGGWGILKDSPLITVKPGGRYLMPDHDQTLYAIWIPEKNTSPSQNNLTASGMTTSGNDSVSMISTWIKSTPKPDEIAAVLAKNAKSKLLKKGSKVTKKGIVYQVTKSGTAKRTVRVVSSKKLFSKLVIPDSISINGYSYQVTAIKKKAFTNQTRVKKIILGENIKTIGKKAFYGNEKLKCILIYSKEIRFIGENAWKRMAKDCQIQFGSGCSRLCRKRVLQMHRQMK